MNKKAFLTLLVLLVVLGGAGLALFWKDLGEWSGSSARIGSRLFEKLPVNEIVRIHMYDAKGAATLELKENRWVVKQRNDYVANHADISELLVKLPEVKVVQTENVGESLLPRLNLVQPPKEPAKEAKDADKMGTQLELFDKSGKVVASLLLGRRVIKIEDSPLPIKQEKPVGRYVLFPGNATVLVLSDALHNAEAKPERWLAKEFFKVEKIKSLTSSGEGANWKIARPEEFGRWGFADGPGVLDQGEVSNINKALTSLTFTDVVLDAKKEAFDKGRTLVAETFEGVTYTLRVAKRPESEDYILSYSIGGEPLKARPPEKGEKPEDKERLDKYFADDIKRLEERLKVEKPLTTWTYVVAAKVLDPLLLERKNLVVEKKPDAEKKK